MKILDKGALELINFMGGDEAVVAAARVSNGALYAEASKGADSDRKLIRFLMKHGHTSPFEHSIFTFYVKAPIFIQREWMRHRTWSYNEISGRYTEYKDDFYIPSIIRTVHPKNKQSSVPMEGISRLAIANIRMKMRHHSQKAFILYEDLMEGGVAREMARMVLPVNLYTQFYATVDAHNLMRFITLRESPDAQFEIQEYARGLHQILTEKMPITAEAFGEFK